MNLLQQVCSLPTAPFAEHYVIAFVRQFARKLRLKVTTDPAGNLLLERPWAGPRRPRWVFAAHMDHPGFVARRMLDPKTLLADFRGWVFASYLLGQRVRFFAGEREIRGVVAAATAHENSGGVAATATIRIAAPVPAPSPGMFDQGVGRFRGRKFLSRALDDLAGVAAALEMLRRLAGRPTKAPIAVLLTRAEEAGMIGAIAAARPSSSKSARDKKLLRRDDRIIAIEISARQSYARQGEGAVVRIGDKTSIFHSGLTYFLVQQAELLTKKDKTFHYQRALMPGGTCEATVYDVYGLAAAAICIPLANYHNMDQDKKKIAPEIVDVRDWQNMVKLFLAIASNAHEYQPGQKFLRQRLEKRFASLKGHLDTGAV